jgi:hypothetical protein
MNTKEYFQHILEINESAFVKDFDNLLETAYCCGCSAEMCEHYNQDDLKLFRARLAAAELLLKEHGIKV